MSGSKDYWGKDLNVNIGRDNFNELRFEYFRDATVAIEAFKADVIDWRTENSAKNWATAYDFPAVKDGRVVKEEFPINSSGGMQALPSTPGVRNSPIRACGARSTSRSISKRSTSSSSSASTSASTATSKAWSWRRADCPRATNWRFLEPLRDKVPPEVFTTPYSNPVNGSPDAVRNNLREATRLLRDAGYEVAGPQARQHQDRRAADDRSADRPAGMGAHRAVLQAVARSAWHLR